MLHNLGRNIVRQNGIVNQIRRTLTSSTNVVCQNTTVPVTSHSVNSDILGKAIASRPFTDWLGRMNQQTGLMKLHGVNIQAVDMFGPKVGFIKFVADVTDKDGSKVPGATFLRGPAVTILFIIKDATTLEKYTILVKVNSVPTGSIPLVLPAGMMDDSRNFRGTLMKEIFEETGLIVDPNKLIDLNFICKGKHKGTHNGYFPSLGGCDEYIQFFAYETTMETLQLDELQGRKTGNISENEKLVVHVIPLIKLIEETPDMKALAALTLYDKYKKLNSQH